MRKRIENASLTIVIFVLFQATKVLSPQIRTFWQFWNVSGARIRVEIILESQKDTVSLARKADFV